MKEKMAIILISAILGLAAVSAVLVYTSPRNVGTSQDLIIWLETDKDVYHINDTIQIRLFAYNPTNKTINLFFGSSQKFSGIIKLTNGSYSKVIYNSSEYHYADGVMNDTIPPSGLYDIQIAHTVTLGTGTYQIRAIGNVKGYDELAIDCEKEILVIASSQ
jgi:hypothetical protein